MTKRSPHQPAVTVLIPARNAANTLAETLESLLGQSYKDFSVVVVDDDSTDKTREIASAFATRFPEGRFQVVDGPGQGIPAARNTGFDQTLSEFVANLDADDICEPDRLLRQVTALQENPDWVAVGGPVSVIDGAGQKIGALASPATASAVRRQLYEKCCLYHSAMLFRREAVMRAGQYRQAFPVAEDYDLYLRLLEQGDIGVLNEPLVRYRRHDHQTTAKLSLEHRMFADMALLSAISRKHNGQELQFHEGRLASDVGAALQAELQERGFSVLSPKIARHIARRVRQVEPSFTQLRSLLLAKNAKARNLKETAKALLV